MAVFEIAMYLMVGITESVDSVVGIAQTQNV